MAAVRLPYVDLRSAGGMKALFILALMAGAEGITVTAELPSVDAHKLIKITSEVGF